MIFGYDDKLELFKKLIKNDDLSHAYLFYGEPEIGKFSFTKVLGNLLEGHNAGEEVPLLDSMFLEAAEGKTLGIEDVLRIQEFLYQSPLLSKRRMAVVNDAGNLTREAQGALLKIVEEPPEHSLIIFIAGDKRDLFEALLSRVEKIYFPALPENKIRSGLSEFFGVDKIKAEKAAALSFGRFGRALMMTKEEKKHEEDNDDFEAELSSDILKLYREGVSKNHRILSWLLERQMSIKRYKRYNLNLKLQKKVVEGILKK
ncbi:hypothetical protein M1506_01330 [Patescibacteria group bacterium]|nr:hypothetical protein [Patescibacteria group bacterium]